MVKPEDKSDFALAGTSNEFTSKSSDIFSALNSLEKKHNAHTNAINKFGRQSYGCYNKEDPETDDFPQPNSGSEFRRPNPPRNAHHRVKGQRTGMSQAFINLDHRKRHWNKYDLSDVDTSDKANKIAALSFLQERKVSSEVDDTQSIRLGESSDNKITFRAPKKQSTDTDTCASSNFISGKLTMPEYVVGVQAKKSKVKKVASSVKKDSERQIGLGHLDNVESDDLGEGSESLTSNVVSEESTSDMKKSMFKKKNRNFRKVPADNDSD